MRPEIRHAVAISARFGAYTSGVVSGTLYGLGGADGLISVAMLGIIGYMMVDTIVTGVEDAYKAMRPPQ